MSQGTCPRDSLKSLATYDENYNKHVTHWMPLPEPPKENT